MGIEIDSCLNCGCVVDLNNVKSKNVYKTDKWNSGCNLNGFECPVCHFIILTDVDDLWKFETGEIEKQVGKNYKIKDE